ncbi:MAG: FMN-binding protein, partial [bacterium]
FLYIIIVSLAIMVIGVAIFTVTVYPKIKEQAEVRKMVIGDVVLSDVKDGSFRGDFTYGDFTYEVEVTVHAQEIKQIRVLQNREESEYAKKAEGVVDKILKTQSLKVDIVTGATTTSKALLKAIENALLKGLEE